MIIIPRLLFEIGVFAVIRVSGKGYDAIIFSLDARGGARGFSIAWRPKFEIRPLFR